MVAVISMVVLEGWQFRLDPTADTIGNIKRATGTDSAFGYVNKVTSQLQAFASKHFDR